MTVNSAKRLVPAEVASDGTTMMHNKVDASRSLTEVVKETATISLMKGVVRLLAKMLELNDL